MASVAAEAAKEEMSETPESSLQCLGKILYRHMGLDINETPRDDEEILLWQCSLLLLKFRSSSRWRNVDTKAKGFLKSMVVSVTRKYPLFGEKVGSFGRRAGRPIARVMLLFLHTSSVCLHCVLWVFTDSAGFILSKYC